MRKFVYITLLGLLTLFLGGCQREQQSESEVPLRFETVAVSIGQDNGNVADSPETRSLITVEAENFQDAYLFAFDATTKEILSYPEHAGDLEGSKPVAIYTTAKTFNWALPIGHAMDVWVVVNAGDAFTDFLNDCLGDPSLVEDDLYGTNMMFRCENGTQLKALETDGPGIPMSGRMDNVTLASVNDGLSVTVKRLFAKYNIYFDMSGYTSQGYVVKSTYLMSSKSNTEVPFFWNGNYQQTDPSKLATVDRSTENDLITLDAGGQVTLYYLENCQGDKPGASSWKSVYKDLGASAVSKCSYMEVGVNVSKASTGEDVSYFHRIYLGKTDMKSNFDVERNLFKTIKLYLAPPADPDEPGWLSGDIFAFTNTNSLSVAPGESISIPFETTIDDQRVLEYLVEKSGVSSSDLNSGSFIVSPKQSGGSYRYNSTDVPYVGTLTLTADASANEGTLDVTGGKNLMAESDKVSSTVKVSIMEPTVLNVAYEIQKLGSYVNEWSKIRLPEASSDSPVVVSITKNGRQSPFCTLSCGGSNSSAGYDYWGLAWDASSKVLYASGYDTENIIILEQEGKETTVIDYNLRKPVLGPDVTEMSGNASVSYEDGIAHVILDDTGSDSYIRIVPFDPVTQTKISGETFAIPSIVNSNIYYAFENGSLDTNVDVTGNPERFNYSYLPGDDHAFELGNVRFAGEKACTESEGYYVEVMHSDLMFTDCMMKITVNPYTQNVDLGAFHNTQVSTGQDVGCTIPVSITSSNYEIKRYVYEYNDTHAEANEASWNSVRTASAEASMSINNRQLVLAPIGTDQERYPCGTYLVRTTIVNPYNNETRYGYYMFDLVLDINIIPNFIFNFGSTSFTERVGYYDYSHVVSSYNIGLTYHCPLSKKGSSFVERVAPTVVAQFEYEDVNGGTGPQLIKGYEGLFESDYNGPKSRTMTFGNVISWTGTVDSENDYWKTNYWLTNRGSEYIFTNIFEMNEGGWHAGYNEFNWFFNNKNDSSTTLDVLLGNSNWSKSQDSGFYHIGKVTDTIIEMTYEDGWLHY